MNLDSYIVHIWHLQQIQPFNYHALYFKLVFMALLLFYLFHVFKGVKNV